MLIHVMARLNSSMSIKLTDDVISRLKSHKIITAFDFIRELIDKIIAITALPFREIGVKMCQIKVTHVTATHHLLNLLYNLTHTLSENYQKYKLIIIDSLPSLFVISSDNHDDLYALNHFANVCRFLSNEYSIPIITVNSVAIWQDSEFSLNAPSGTVLKSTTIMKPFLGKYWSNIPNTRLYIEHIHSEKRTITVWKSNNNKIGTSIEITLNNSGII
ncbi:hypothetical protein PV327_007603 [Microctonus hyperodae]|uniref:DNA recombination and repair protein Rad51-like C-terminal domain-containing protein n=1 Tax=Microctonus hyperodae TaxID=165561 RepID=A0AA39FZI7_MICHY|nr:hypothetical protein PV327_007603 [Microctonus hyperodae]